MIKWWSHLSQGVSADTCLHLTCVDCLCVEFVSLATCDVPWCQFIWKFSKLSFTIRTKIEDETWSEFVLAILLEKNEKCVFCAWVCVNDIELAELKQLKKILRETKKSTKLMLSQKESCVRLIIRRRNFVINFFFNEKWVKCTRSFCLPLVCSRYL